MIKCSADYLLGFIRTGLAFGVNPGALIKCAAVVASPAAARKAYPGPINNPANMRYYGVGWLGERGKGLRRGQFTRFDTPQNGLRAASRLLVNIGNDRAKTRRFTINEVMPVFSPRKENNTARHIRNVSAISGLKPDQVLDRNNTGQMVDLLRGVVGAESGEATQNWFTPQEYTNAVLRARQSL